MNFGIKSPYSRSPTGTVNNKRGKGNSPVKDKSDSPQAFGNYSALDRDDDNDDDLVKKNNSN
jgi:hypothetical protein